jgi:putative ABC transport system substrate-binding protein
MKRRDFIAATAALLVSPRPLRAAGPPRRVGYLDPAFKNLPIFKVWQDSLLVTAGSKGKNLIVDYRSAEGTRRAPIGSSGRARHPQARERDTLSHR